MSKDDTTHSTAAYNPPKCGKIRTGIARAIWHIRYLRAEQARTPEGNHLRWLEAADQVITRAVLQLYEAIESNDPTAAEKRLRNLTVLRNVAGAAAALSIEN